MIRSNYSDFGKLVNSRLIEINMTQIQLAKIVGASDVYLSMILRGKRAGYKYMDKIRELLDLPDNGY